MADTHMRIQNVILWKRYIVGLEFVNTRLTVTYSGGAKEYYTIDSTVTPEEIAAYKAELEDRDI
jgi:hypothetical protein